MQRHRCCTEEWPACSIAVGVQAGTGCHEGGIILSKKPPEWHLPLPQPSSRYDEPHPILIFAAAKKNGPVLH